MAEDHETTDEVEIGPNGNQESFATARSTDTSFRNKQTLEEGEVEIGPSGNQESFATARSTDTSFPNKQTLEEGEGEAGGNSFNSATSQHRNNNVATRGSEQTGNAQSGNSDIIQSHRERRRSRYYSLTRFAGSLFHLFGESSKSPSIFGFDEIEVEDGDFDFELEADIFSMLFVAKNPGQTFALGVYVLQIIIMAFIFLDIKDDELRRAGVEDDNKFNVPVAVETKVAASQFLALIIAVVSQDDALVSIDALFLVDYDPAIQVTHPHATLWRWKITNFLRWSEGMLTLLLSFTLVGQSDTVLDIFMNFAAVQFVSNLDNVAFSLSESGYLGTRLKRNTEAVRELKCFHRDRHPWRMLLTQIAFAGNLIVLLIGWSVLRYLQKHGHYLEDQACDSVLVMFGDAEFEIRTNGEFPSPLEYSHFNGEYMTEFQGEDRPTYIEHAIGLNRVQRGKFYYCDAEKSWHFTVPALVDYLPEGTKQYCKHGWLLQSPITAAYVLEDAPQDNWKMISGIEIVENLGYVSLQCGDCDRDADCNFHGKCRDGRCDCEDDWTGRACNVKAPYKNEIIWIHDGERAKDYKEEGPFMLVNTTKDPNEQLKVYSRPVYAMKEFHETGCGKVVMYAGRRWYRTWKCREDLHDGNFHAYWNNFLEGNSSHISDPNNEGVPTGFEWNLVRSNRARGSFARNGASSPISARFEAMDLDCSRPRICGIDGKCAVKDDGHHGCVCLNGSGGYHCEYSLTSEYSMTDLMEIEKLIHITEVSNWSWNNPLEALIEIGVGGDYFWKYWWPQINYVLDHLGVIEGVEMAMVANR